MDRFAVLRECLSQEPSTTTWSSICAMLMEWPPGEERNVAMAYAERHAQDWDDAYRAVQLCSFIGPYRLGMPSSIWSLYRSFVLGSCRERTVFRNDELTAFLFSPWMRSIPLVCFPTDQPPELFHNTWDEQWLPDMLEVRRSIVHETAGLPLEEANKVWRGAYLVGEPGDGPPPMFFLYPGVNRAGRQYGSYLHFPDPPMDMMHAAIHFEDDVFVVRDADSGAGTFVNGERIQERTLQEGDRLQLGLVRLLFSREGERAFNKALLPRLLNDPLTGLLSNAVFSMCLEQRKTACHFGREVSVIVLDAIGMAAINAQNGWEAGDRFLCDLANGIRQRAPADALAGRWGGDQLAVLVRDMDKDELRVWSERFCRDFRSEDGVRSGQQIRAVAMRLKPTSSMMMANVMCGAALSQSRDKDNQFTFA